MIKFIGGTMIFLSAAAYGFKRAYTPYRRYKNLGNVLSALIILENEISFTQTYIDDIFVNIANILKTDKLFKTAVNMPHDVQMSKRWEQAVMKDYNNLSFTDDDAQILISLSQGLGITNRTGQIQSIKHIHTLIEIQIKHAYEEYVNQSKLFKGLGVCVGLFIIILLI